MSASTTAAAIQVEQSIEAARAAGDWSTVFDLLSRNRKLLHSSSDVSSFSSGGGTSGTSTSTSTGTSSSNSSGVTLDVLYRCERDLVTLDTATKQQLTKAATSEGCLEAAVILFLTPGGFSGSTGIKLLEPLIFPRVRSVLTSASTSASTTSSSPSRSIGQRLLRFMIEALRIIGEHRDQLVVDAVKNHQEEDGSTTPSSSIAMLSASAEDVWRDAFELCCTVAPDELPRLSFANAEKSAMRLAQIISSSSSYSPSQPPRTAEAVEHLRRCLVIQQTRSGPRSFLSTSTVRLAALRLLEQIEIFSSTDALNHRSQQDCH